jgi:hypothetical protein
MPGKIPGAVDGTIDGSIGLGASPNSAGDPTGCIGIGNIVGGTITSGDIIDGSIGLGGVTMLEM